MKRTWLSLRWRAHSSEPILALRAPRVRVAGGIVGEDSAPFGPSLALADLTSGDLVWLSGTGAHSSTLPQQQQVPRAVRDLVVR